MNKFCRYLFIGVIALGLLYLLSFIKSIVIYVLVAWVVSLIGTPIKHFYIKHIRVKKWKIGSSAASALTLFTLILILVTVIMLFVPMFVTQVENLASVNYEQVDQVLQEPYQNVISKLKKFGVDPQPGALANMVENLQEKYISPDNIAGFFANTLSIAGNFLMALFSIFFIAFFFLSQEGLFSGFISKLVTNQYKEKVLHTLSSVTELLSRYFAGILLQITIITIFVSVFLSFLGVQNALLIGFFAALINLIPYLGPIIGGLFGVFIAISSNLDLDFYNEMIPLIVKVILVFATMQMIDNFFLQPTIFSRSVKAHPLEIFIVILIGAQLNGIPGMILAVPVYTILRVLASEFLSQFEVVQNLIGDMSKK